MRIFVDANILFSAADPYSATRTLFDAARRYGATLVFNTHVWEEAHRNILRKSPRFENSLGFLEPKLEKSAAFRKVEDSGLPAQDIPVLGGAAGACCTYLWTGDLRHFGRWYGKSIGDVTVISSSMLAEYLIRKGWSRG